MFVKTGPVRFGHNPCKFLFVSWMKEWKKNLKTVIKALIVQRLHIIPGYAKKLDL